MAKRGRLINDLTGQRFNRLVVVGQAPYYEGKSRVSRWYCRCDCGAEKVVNSSELKKGLTKSCGCYRKEFMAQARNGYKHGGTGTRLHEAWTAINQRCFNASSPVYPLYGGRGITICNEWHNDYAAFRDYMGDPPSDSHSIDRIDNDGNYEPGNVRWATRYEQVRNRRTNKMITHNGRTMCFYDWVKESGIPYSTLHYRIFIAKWPIERALTEKPKSS